MKIIYIFEPSDIRPGLKVMDKKGKICAVVKYPGAITQAYMLYVVATHLTVANSTQVWYYDNELVKFLNDNNYQPYIEDVE